MRKPENGSGLLFGEAEPETNATKDALVKKGPRPAAAPKPAKPTRQQQRQAALYAIEGLERVRAEVVALKPTNCLRSGLLVAINKEINKQRMEMQTA